MISLIKRLVCFDSVMPTMGAFHCGGQGAVTLQLIPDVWRAKATTGHLLLGHKEER